MRARKYMPEPRVTEITKRKEKIVGAELIEAQKEERVSGQDTSAMNARGELQPLDV